MSANNPPASARILLVLADDFLREALAANMPQSFAVIAFASPAAAIRHLKAGNACDVLVIELAAAPSLEPLRAAGVDAPVVILAGRAGRADMTEEEAALASGAADFIDIARGPLILAKRIEAVARRRRTQPALSSAGDLRLGALEIAGPNRRVSWRGRAVRLTESEFRLVEILVKQAGRHVGHRAIHAHVSRNPSSGALGDAECQTYVRSFVSRVRRKFHAVDTEFDAIESYWGYGYRWRLPSSQSKG